MPFYYIHIRCSLSLHFSHLFSILEYAANGSLYAFLQRPENVLHFEHILQWAEEIAMGKLSLFPGHLCFLPILVQIEIENLIKLIDV